MAISAVRNNGRATYGVTHYYVDTEEDVANLPNREDVGSSATVIATGNKYLINSKGQWILQSNNSGGGGGGGNSTTIIGTLPVDNDSIVYENNELSIKGFQDALERTHPVKTADGTIEWVTAEDNITAVLGDIPEGQTVAEYVNQLHDTTVQEVQINNQPVQMVDNTVNIPVASQDAHGLVKGSEDIAVNEDGSLQVSKVSLDSLENGTDEIILHGGSAIL